MGMAANWIDESQMKLAAPSMVSQLKVSSNENKNLTRNMLCGVHNLLAAFWLCVRHRFCNDCYFEVSVKCTLIMYSKEIQQRSWFVACNYFFLCHFPQNWNINGVTSLGKPFPISCKVSQKNVTANIFTCVGFLARKVSGNLEGCMNKVSIPSQHKSATNIRRTMV